MANTDERCGLWLDPLRHDYQHLQSCIPRLALADTVAKPRHQSSADGCGVFDLRHIRAEPGISAPWRDMAMHIYRREGEEALHRSCGHDDVGPHYRHTDGARINPAHLLGCGPGYRVLLRQISYRARCGGDGAKSLELGDPCGDPADRLWSLLLRER